MDVRELTGRQVLVAGGRVSGLAMVRALVRLGARVVATDSNPAMLDQLTALGAEAHLDLQEPPAGTELVCTVPGFRPDAPLLRAAAAAGLPVWGDVELAWWCDQAEVFGPRKQWLVVTGTNGKTTTTTMLDAILTADGLASTACGNIGRAVLDVLLAEPALTHLAVELSSFQLHWAPSVRPAAGAVLNIAEDHLDWHGGMAAYTAAKAQVLTGDVAVVGVDDPAAAALGEQPRAGRTVGFTLGEPTADQLGVVGDALVDRAFGDGPEAHTVLAHTADVTPAGPPGLLDALAAAALARSAGVAPESVAAGLRAVQQGAHRAVLVATHDGVDYVDDSKATNPHAALASVTAHPRVVWVAGGLLKGASVDALVQAVADRLVGAVLLGRDRAVIADALRRHAPQIPVVEVGKGHDGPMSEVLSADAAMSAVVGEAARLAQPGDVVLLAPAAASMDMFTDYGHRGDAFAAAAQALATGATAPGTER
ncbi:UDP-N-acetylmuramoyl-L-alanine--D-glutamate ligase [Rhodococcus sp. X156]|uniref:UDP-N-acetylmuramoyl-L-alanine--D-glutamate ligase n=1 Tax=Rhodococcus sp. X156 TaxID=2499145 RepID=UPI001F49BE84|nr:UDP-N-acetylmuramoyl-L-alanine--D-glutamate ligase [Rhodococcus sp. X156]